MKRMMVALGVLAFAAGACELEKSNAAKSAKVRKAKPAKAETRPVQPTREVDKAKTTPPDRKPEPPRPPATTERHDTKMCNVLLPVTVVERTLGMKGFAPAKGLARLRKGASQCDYWIAQDGTGKGSPRASVGMRIDCSRGRVTRERMEAVLAKRPNFKRLGEYLYLSGNKQHSLWGWSKNPPCTLSVATGGIEANKVEALMKYVLSKLNPAIAPKENG